ncbi:MAG: type II secretion system F family protein, partial [Planctomycetota bacterium]
MLMLHVINIVVFIGFLFLAWKKPGLALVLLPIIAIGMFLSGLIYFDGEVVDDGIVIFLLPIILLPASTCLIHYSPSSGQLETPRYKTVTKVILTLFKYTLILALFCLAFQFLGPIIFALFIVGAIGLNKAQKCGLVIDIISTIGTSMRQSLPLPTALAAAAHGQKKKVSRVFNNIAHWLTQGCPLSEALRRGYPKCPSNILASITAAEKVDQLPKAIESLQADIAEKMGPKNIEKSDTFIYPITVLTIAFFIMMGLAIFIIPTFSEVLSDISEGQASLPFATQSLM